MIETVGRANMDFMVRLAKDPDWAKAELEKISDTCTQRGATFMGRPLPIPVKPHFISAKQRRVLERGLTGIHRALERFIGIFLESKELQRMWGASPEEMELYRIDPGYPDAIQIARFDGFLQDHDLQFLEFNCDSPGGTGYADVIHNSFLEFFDRNDMGSGYAVSNRQRLLHLAETLSSCYAAWRRHHPSRPEKPFVVACDWEDVASRPDIEITVRHLVQAGFDAVFADPRELTTKKDGSLYLNKRRVDLVYKRVILRELPKKEGAGALARSYKAGKVCLVNSPRSVIVGNKKILAALRLPEVHARLSREEKEAVARHVPWTEVLRDAKVEFRGFVVNLRDFVVDNKDKLVLKAAESYGGKDVVLGFEADAAHWRRIVDEHIQAETWVVQELVPIPRELFPRISKGNVEMELLNVNINPLAFGGKYAGSYTRLSKKNIINVSIGGGMTPTMTIEAREADHAS